MFLLIYSVITVNEINLISKNSTTLDRKCQFEEPDFCTLSAMSLDIVNLFEYSVPVPVGA